MDITNREKIIIRMSIFGIIANLLLAITKALIGYFSNSIAIVIDAINNLTDTLSSIITLIGTILANKPADKEHPFGHGRMEDTIAIVIACIIIYVGGSSFIEAIKKIIHKQIPTYDSSIIFILIIVIIIKIIISYSFIKKGKLCNSNALIASGKDAISDVIISISTLLSAIVFIYLHITIEAYLALMIAIIIIRTGINTMKETTSRIMGERIDTELAQNIKKQILGINGVYGVSDLVLNYYGPKKNIGSVNIEVDYKMTADSIDDLTRKIQYRIYKKFNINLLSIGIYAIDKSNEEVVKMYHTVLSITKLYKQIIQMHGFSVNLSEKHMHFDIVVDFECNFNEIKNKLIEEIKKKYNEYDINIVIDNDISD